MHQDRLSALIEHDYQVVGVEVTSQSNTYSWVSDETNGYVKKTLFLNQSTHNLSQVKIMLKLMLTCIPLKEHHFFFCHYEQPYVFFTAILLKLLGRKVFVMNNAKFDDSSRNILLELVKVVLYSPYNGALVGSERASAYLSLLGMKNRPKVLGYNTLSIERIRTNSGTVPAPKGLPFDKRHFSIISRLVPKKNLFMAIDAYTLYASKVQNPRPLHIYGDGPLESKLQEYIVKKKQLNNVILHGFIQSDDISKALGQTLALLLPSSEEQFGNVVIEAQAMGVPVLATYLCGAADELIRDGINGFTFTPDNPEGLAFFMHEVCQRKDMWNSLSKGTELTVYLGDTKRFVSGISRLID